MTTQLHPPDQELWSAAGHDDRTAFGELFDRYARTVYNHAFRLTGSWSLAEEVTQATFLVAWRRRGQARFVDGSVLPWLLVVATNAARTERRAAMRWRVPLRRARPPDDQPDPAEEVAARLDDERRMAGGRTALPARCSSGAMSGTSTLSEPGAEKPQIRPGSGIAQPCLVRAWPVAHSSA